MTIEEIIVSETASVAVAYPQVIPAGVDEDCIVYQLISEPHDFGDRVNPRYQLTGWSKTYGGAVVLGQEIRQTFHQQHQDVSGLHYQSMAIDERDAPPAIDAGWYGRMVDVRFFYQKSL
jgi:hypothetical protein